MSFRSCVEETFSEGRHTPKAHHKSHVGHFDVFLAPAPAPLESPPTCTWDTCPSKRTMPLCPLSLDMISGMLSQVQLVALSVVIGVNGEMLK